MKINKQAALLTLLTVGMMIVIIIALVTLCLYVPTMYIIGGICVFLFIGIIRGIYNIHCDNWDF